MLSDRAFLRYQRQIALPEIGEIGQSKLKRSSVLIIGCGGLGSAAGMYLAAAGVGQLVISDDDVVETSNLQRQVIYRASDINTAKVDAMASQMQSINDELKVRKLNKRLTQDQLYLEVMMADVVLDCSDNLSTRHMVNRVCQSQAKPLISGSAIGWQGQFAVFDFVGSQTGCYQCLVPEEAVHRPNKCSESGILGPVVGTIGNYQALAALQVIALDKVGIKPRELHLFDGMSLKWQTLTIRPDSECRVCGQYQKAS
ncbi:MAG: HesA/MoeB/ThiF family protein [Vibrionaceae bacterium]|nr:HesA/MoeB/ThiF family protein [Vibrionaceae bacterium]